MMPWMRFGREKVVKLKDTKDRKQEKHKHNYHVAFTNLHNGKAYSITHRCDWCGNFKEEYTDRAREILENSGLKAYERFLENG